MRRMAYKYLAKITGRQEAHIRDMDVAECQEVMERIKKDYPGLFKKLA